MREGGRRLEEREGQRLAHCKESHCLKAGLVHVHVELYAILRSDLCDVL